MTLIPLFVHACAFDGFSMLKICVNRTEVRTCLSLPVQLQHSEMQYL